MKLSEACEINPRSQAISDDTLISFVAMPDVSEDGRINTSVVRPYGDVKKGYTIFQEGDVLFAKITPCMENGKGAQALGLQNGIGVGSTEFHILRPNPDLLDGMWLYYLTAWPAFRHEAEIHMTGSAGQKRVPKAFLERYQVDIPALNEQKVQVSQLDRVRRIIESRQRQLRTLDTLIKARFVELFGDPSVNSKSYPERQLGELVINIIPGWSANGESRRMQGAEKAVLKVSAVTQGVFKPEEHKALPMGTEIKKYVYPHKGDLLFSRANTRELVGATAIIDQDYPNLILPDKLWRVLFTNEINVYYAKYVLSTEAIRREFSAQSTGTSGSMFNVSAEKFCAIMIPVPPIHEQELFAAFVSQVDKSKAVVQAALDKAQLLFDSLMQQYFG